MSRYRLRQSIRALIRSRHSIQALYHLSANENGGTSAAVLISFGEQRCSG